MTDVTDIVARLRDPASRWMALSEPDPLRLEAAAEIDRLQRELDDRTAQANIKMFDQRAEIERLQALRSELNFRVAEVVDLKAESKRVGRERDQDEDELWANIERLRAALENWLALPQGCRCAPDSGCAQAKAREIARRALEPTT